MPQGRNRTLQKRLDRLLQEAEAIRLAAGENAEWFLNCGVLQLYVDAVHTVACPLVHPGRVVAQGVLRHSDGGDW